jgi:hypothetical protein
VVYLGGIEQELNSDLSILKQKNKQLMTENDNLRAS